MSNQKSLLQNYKKLFQNIENLKISNNACLLASTWRNFVTSLRRQIIDGQKSLYIHDNKHNLKFVINSTSFIKSKQKCLRGCGKKSNLRHLWFLNYSGKLVQVNVYGKVYFKGYLRVGYIRPNSDDGINKNRKTELF